MPLQLPAAVFAQVEGLEDLLQSHHLDDDNGGVTERHTLCIYCAAGYKNSPLREKILHLQGTNLRRQVYFHRDVGRPVAHRQDVHRQLDVSRNVLALHILQKHTHTREIIFSCSPNKY